MEKSKTPTTSPPIVIPVRPEEKTKPDKEVHPNLMQLPSVTMLASPICTGKSTIISNLLLNEDFYGQHFFDKVVIFSNTIMNCTTSRFLCKRFECHTQYTDEKLQELIEFGDEANAACAFCWCHHVRTDGGVRCHSQTAWETFC